MRRAASATMTGNVCLDESACNSRGEALSPRRQNLQMYPAKRTVPELVDGVIRVVLVGNERVTRAGLRMLIDAHAGLRVIAEMECTGNLESVWFASQPQVVLVDLDSHPHADFIPDLREAGVSNIRLILLTSTPDSTECSRVIERGVLGVVSKQQGPEILIKAIERVHAGEVWLNRARIAGVIGTLRRATAADSQKASELVDLTPRERQIIALVGKGLRNNEIAETIFVSEATVRNCLGSIFRKLGMSNRVNLMIYAIREGVVTQPERPSPSASRDTLRLATSDGHPRGDRRRT